MTVPSIIDPLIVQCCTITAKYVLLGHNTIRGAAGASILNAELFKVEGLLPA